MKINLLLVLFFIQYFIYAQTATIVKGKVLNAEDKTPIVAATITTIKSTELVITNDKGEFILESTQALPFKLKISVLGFLEQYYTVSKKGALITILLQEAFTGLDAIVLSASKTPERVFESPVAIERMGLKQIENTTAATFYDGLEYLKGVDVNTSSLTFKSVNTRGFADFNNVRFLQLVDGMDNASPGLNYPLGNLIGLNELDVQSVELLPGASSALYGANAFNGVLLMRSKNPFQYQGTSAYAKSGVTSSNNAGSHHFIDAGVRVAKKVNDQFALKFTTSLLKATDWFASDTRNINSVTRDIVQGDRLNTKSYNGINVYGDEVSTNLGSLGVVSRTGYDESSLVDYGASNFKLGLSMHLKPFKDENIEFVYNSKFGTGNTILQGASRTALRDFIMYQHKLEIKSKHLLMRSYVTFDNAGDSYDIRFAGININNAWKDNTTWFTEYGAAYAGLISGVAGGSDASARNFADRDRLIPGSLAFKKAFDQVTKSPDLTKGAKFVDNSKLYHTDVNYNFKELIEFAEVQIGGSARRYVLDSDETIFTDSKNEAIVYDEFGIYTQLQKKLVDRRLKLTGSIRYDKSQNFDGNFSPRLSVSFSPDQNKKHHIRASFQTAFRNPTTQDQYIGLDLGNTKLIGSAPENLDRYAKTISNSLKGQALGFKSTDVFTGRRAYEQSFTLDSALEFGVLSSSGDVLGAIAGLEKTNLGLVKPEQVISYEIGYRGKLAKKTTIDFNAYYNQYKDFISVVNVVVPNYGNADFSDIGTSSVGVVAPLPNAVWALIHGDSQVASLYTNTTAKVSSYGVNFGLETIFTGGYIFGINYSFAKQKFNQAEDPNFDTNFNTPEHKVKVSLDNSNFYKGLGFGVNLRWQDAFYWQSGFVNAMVAARTVLDAQLTYHINKGDSSIKIGGANVLNQQYVSAPGAGVVGSQYYLSWTSNF